MYIGVNIDGNSQEQTAAPFVNMAHSFDRWGDLTPQRAALTPNQLDANGYPTIPAKTVAGLAGYPDGDYQFSYRGPANAFVFDGSLSITVPPILGSDGFWRGVVRRSGGGVGVTVQPGVSDWQLIRPGYPADTQQIWHDGFVADCGNFALLRFMDLMKTNNSIVRQWSDRAKLTDFPWTGKAGIPYEADIELANVTGRNPWVCVPHLADDDYVHQLAALWHKGLDPSLKIYVEYSNEIWNTDFQQFHDLFSGPAAASVLPDLPAAPPFNRLATWIGARNYQVAQIWKQEWGADAGRVRCVYGGRLQVADGIWWNDQGLQYIARHYGKPSDTFYALAGAPYVYSRDDAATATLDGLFAALDSEFTTQVVPWLKAMQAQASNYGLKFISYEGGQHLVGKSNYPVKLAAQTDPRMGDLYKRLIAACEAAGMESFTHLSYCGPYSANGFWGLKQKLDDNGAVKWKTLLALQPPGLPPVPGYQKPPVSPPPVSPPPPPSMPWPPPEGCAVLTLQGKQYVFQQVK